MHLKTSVAFSNQFPCPERSILTYDYHFLWSESFVCTRTDMRMQFAWAVEPANVNNRFRLWFRALLFYVLENRSVGFVKKIIIIGSSLICAVHRNEICNREWKCGNETFWLLSGHDSICRCRRFQNISSTILSYSYWTHRVTTSHGLYYSPSSTRLAITHVNLMSRDHWDA